MIRCPLESSGQESIAEVQDAPVLCERTSVLELKLFRKSCDLVGGNPRCLEQEYRNAWKIMQSEAGISAKGTSSVKQPALNSSYFSTL